MLHTFGGVYGSSSSELLPPRNCSGTRPYQRGDSIVLVGKIEGRRPSRDFQREHLERIPKFDDELFGYNLEGRMLLLRQPKNDREFDSYVSLPFAKGVTERETGRTLLILGSNAHHIEAMQGQFSGVIWHKTDQKEVKKYGDTLRWINVGNTKYGFIGLDYKPAAKKEDGVANSLDDIIFLAKTLIELGYDSNKKLYLLNPPYIAESDLGKKLRAGKYFLLKDYICGEKENLSKILGSARTK